mgnify:CR=1 FL=1
MHLGHQAVLAALRGRAEQYGLPSLLITFEPQPLEFFRHDQAPARLTRLREKLEAIADCGVDRVLLINTRKIAEGPVDEVFTTAVGTAWERTLVALAGAPLLVWLGWRGGVGFQLLVLAIVLASLYLKRKDGSIDALYEYWMMGGASRPRKPRAICPRLIFLNS